MKKIILYSLIALNFLLFINCGGSVSHNTSTEKNTLQPLISDKNTTTPTNSIKTSNIYLKYKLAKEIKESSGLIKVDNQLWTHNDSDNEAKLYQIDENNGKILKTFTITNANNIDWEDISYDENYIYIGDFGNNKGNRTDLKIYKILRNELKTQISGNAEIINFKYSDQQILGDKNFDCEALIAYQHKLYLFSKNWKDNKTRLYELNTSAGNHIANYISSFNIHALVTGATIDKELNILLLSTYSPRLNVNIWSFSNYHDNNFFNGDIKKLTLTAPLQAQIEGITFIDKYKAYLSSEAFYKQAYGIELDNNLYELDYSKEFF